MDREKQVMVEVRAGSEFVESKESRPSTEGSKVQTAMFRQAPPGTTPVAPVKHVGDVAPLPQTGEIHRDKMPTSVPSISLSPRSTTDSSSTEVASFWNMIVEADRTIHQCSKYQHGVPREVHSRVLQILRERHRETISVPNSTEWSDGSMWLWVLEAGDSANHRGTILTILECIGAWEWYEGQIKLARATVRTKKNKPVNHRGAAIHVLNKLQGFQTGPEQPGKWVGGVGRLDLGKEGDESGMLSESGNVNITERATQLRRKLISMQLSRGRKLCTKLVKGLGLGILFDPNIW